MKAEVTITMRCANEEVIIKNDKGCSWRYEMKKPELDIPTAACVANLAASMLAATITAQLLATDETSVKYKLEVLTGAECR